MNETVRSLVAGAAGAVVAISVVVGQPALAHEVDQVKAKKVTSAMIKNGTIQSKDLNAQVNGSLAKAASALQSVPEGSVTSTKLADNSVTSSKVADGSLTASDLGLAHGTLNNNFPPLTPGQCAASSPIPTGHDVTGHAVLTNEPGNIAGSIYIYARQDPVTSTSIDIVVCSIGTTFDPPTADFTWVLLPN